jgi:hypothetical protein
MRHAKPIHRTQSLAKARLQRIDSFEEIGQTLRKDRNAALKHVRDGRVAVHESSRGDIARHTGAATHFCRFADRDVPAQSGLAGQHDIVAQRSAAGDAHLGTNETVFADDYVVGDLHEIIDLGALADLGAAETRAVERAVGPDLDVVSDYNVADLRDFFVAPLDEFVTKTIGTNDRPGCTRTLSPSTHSADNTTPAISQQSLPIRAPRPTKFCP